MEDPRTSRLERVLDQTFKPLIDLVVGRVDAAAKSSPQTRADAEACLARLRAELAGDQTRLPDLRLSAQAAIESHIADCYREIRRLEAGDQVATGELHSRYLADAVDDLNACLDNIRFTRNEIEDLEKDLGDDSLW